MFGWNPRPSTENTVAEGAFYSFEHDVEEPSQETPVITEADCCWCYPNTIANAVCNACIERIANTPRVRRH